MLEAVRYVDFSYSGGKDGKQKINDIKEYHVDICVMGSDWENSDPFKKLEDYCELKFLSRTEGISTTKIKEELGSD